MITMTTMRINITPDIVHSPYGKLWSSAASRRSTFSGRAVSPIKPMRQIVEGIRARHPDTPIIAFPRGAGERYAGAHAAIGADCIAVDDGVSAEWVAEHVQSAGCVQGNLASSHMVTGGQSLVDETRRIVRALSGGPHIFNLGHGITPDADPDNVQRMIDAVREG